MKSKKLFAILTLVAFMMTLLPLAAFAATNVPGDPAQWHLGADTVYSSSRSTVSVEDSNLDAYFNIATPTANNAAFTITFKDSSGVKLASTATVDFAIKTSSDLVQGWIDEDGSKTYNAGEEIDAAKAEAMASADGMFLDNVELNADSAVEVHLGAARAVSFDVKFFAGVDSDANQIGKTKSVNVQLEEGAITLNAYADEDDDDADNLAGGATHAGAIAVNAGDGYELRANLPSDEEDVEVTFYEKEYGGTYTVLGKSTTDADGQATIWVDAEKKADFVYKAKTSDEDSAELFINVAAATADEVTLKTVAGTKYAVDHDGDVEFYIKDEYGNGIAGDTADITITSAPADSDLEDQTYTTGTSVAPDGKAKFSFHPDEVGKYTIRAEVANGRRISVEVEAVDFDKATSLKFKLKNLDDQEVAALTRANSPATQANNEVDNKAGNIEVWGVSASGAEVKLDAADVTLGSSNNVQCNVNAGGVAGDVILNKDATGTYQVTAYYSEDDVMGTYDLKVVGGISSISATPVVNGKEATVNLQYVDKDGNNTYWANDPTPATDEAYTVSVPAGLTVTDNHSMNDRGAGNFKVTAAEYGTYKVTVLTAEKHVSKTFDLTFGVPASEKTVIGAKSVTMFIGATGYVADGAAKVGDVAPFIKDGRTFVAVRALSDAFGATAAWNEATQTVTLTRSDMTLTIVIGKAEITKVAGGVTSTIKADVPAFIKDGRTVLPFRAVGEAFGATVGYDAATQAVSFAQ